jgi:Sec-independent protein translocase protein TatA
MEFLGIGPLELLFIFLIALIVLGPKDIVKTGRMVGRVLRKIVTSPQWRTINQTSKEIRNLPNRLIREAGLEDEVQQIQELQKSLPDMKQARIDLDTTIPGPTIIPPAVAAAISTTLKPDVSPTTTPSPSEMAGGNIPDPSNSAPDSLSAWTNPPTSPTIDTGEAKK